MESPSSLTLSRMTRPPGNFGGLQAAYVENSVGPHIEFYDEALKSSTHFSGDPSAPSLMSEWTLLHEIGHAIAAAPRRDLEQIFNRKKERYESLRSQYNELVDEGKTLARTPTRATDKRIEAIQQTLTAFGQELEGLEAELNRLAALAEVIQQPLHQSFIAEIQDLELAPTLYARTSIDEAFTECFAMFRIDPAALQRTNPGIYSWFNTGKHIEGIRASVTLVSSDD